MRDYRHRLDQVPVMAPVSVTSTIQLLRAMPQPFKGRGTGRGSVSSGRGRKASDRGATQAEARLPSLVYAA